MIYCRRSLWFLVGLLIAASFNFAYAAFPATPPASTYQRPSLPSINMPTTTASNMVSLTGGTHCQVYFNSSTSNTYHYLGPTSNPGSACSPSLGGGYTGSHHAASNSYMFTVSPYNLAVPGYSCPNYTGATAPLCTLVNAPYTCPANSTISGSGAGSVCTCDSGYSESGSSCVANPTCPAADTLVKGYIAKNLNPGVVCFGNCEATIVSAHNQAAVAGVQVIAGVWAYTANNSCSGPPSATAGFVTPSTCPANTCPGEVNGTFTCLPCSDAAPDESWKKLKDVKTNADGSTTTTETTEKTVCNGDTCATEKTVSKTETPSGGGAGTTENTTQKTEQTQEDFCAANPNSDKCKKEGAGTAAAISGLYESESATFQGVYDGFKSDVAAAPLIAAATGFFNVSAGAGTCPTWTWNAGDWGTYTIDIFCEPTLIGIFEVVGNIVLLGAVLAAIFIALF